MTSSRTTLPLALAVLLLAGTALVLLGTVRSWEEHARAGEERAADLAERLDETLAAWTSDRAGTQARERELAVAVAAGEARTIEVHGLAAALRITALVSAREALAEGRPAQARERLERVPVDRRGWAWRHLALRAERVVETLVTHAADVVALSASADGARLASADEDGHVRVTAIAERAESASLPPFDTDVSVLALDRRGVRLAVGLHDGRVVVHALETDLPVSELALEGTPTALAFAPDGRLGIGLAEGALMVWSPAAGDAVPPRWETGAGGVESLAASPDGGAFAFGTDEGAVGLVEVADGAVRLFSSGHDDWVGDVSFDAAGAALVSASDDGSLCLLDLASGTPRERISGGDAALLLARLGPEGRLRRLDERGELIERAAHDTTRFRFPLEPETRLLAAAAPESGAWLAVASGDERVRLLTPRSAHHRRLPSTGRTVRAVAASAGGGRVVAGSSDGSVHVYDGSRGALLGRHAGARGVAAVAITPDGERVAVGSRAGGVEVLGAHADVLVPIEETARIAAVGLTRDGSRVVSVGRHGSTRSWDAATGALLVEIPEPQGLVFTGALDPTAGVSAWIGDAGTIRLWDPAAGTRRAAFRERDLGRVLGFVLATEGERLLVHVEPGKLFVLDGVEGGVVSLAREERREVTALAIEPAGTCTAVATRDGFVTIRDAGSGRTLIELAGTGDPVQALAFAPEGALLVAGTVAGDVLLWEAPPPSED